MTRAQTPEGSLGLGSSQPLPMTLLKNMQWYDGAHAAETLGPDADTWSLFLKLPVSQPQSLHFINDWPYRHKDIMFPCSLDLCLNEIAERIVKKKKERKVIEVS